MTEPSAADWDAIQKAVDGDCAMSIVGAIQRGDITGTAALDRITAYAKAAFQRGFSEGIGCKR